MSGNYVLKMYDKLSGKPFGKWLFTHTVARRAPYFKSISPLITELHSGYCECFIKKRKSVQNHIGTVHVIAICNGIEMAMGVMAEASIPKHLRWIPKEMHLSYTAKAGTDIRCIAQIDDEAWQPGDLDIPVVALDTNGTTVVEGTIRLWISGKLGSSDATV